MPPPPPPTDFEHPRDRLKRLRRQYGAKFIKKGKSGVWLWPRFPAELESVMAARLKACEAEHEEFFRRIGL